MMNAEEIRKEITDANARAAVDALQKQVSKAGAAYGAMNRDVQMGAKEGGEIVGKTMAARAVARPMTSTAGLVMNTAAGDAQRVNRTEQQLNKAKLDADGAYLGAVGQKNADAMKEQQAKAKAETLAQYGDFSGFSELGYDASQVGNMQAAFQRKQQAAEAFEGLGKYAQTLLDLYGENAAFDIGANLQEALDNGLISKRDYTAALIASRGIIPGSKAKKNKGTGTNPTDAPMTAAEEAFSRIEGMRGDKYIVKTMDDWKALQGAYGDKMVDYFVYEPEQVADLVYVPGYGEITWEEAYALEQQGAIDVTEDKNGNTVFYQLRPGSVSTRMQR